MRIGANYFDMPKKLRDSTDCVREALRLHDMERSKMTITFSDGYGFSITLPADNEDGGLAFAFVEMLKACEVTNRAFLWLEVTNLFYALAQVGDLPDPLLPQESEQTRPFLRRILRLVRDLRRDVNKANEEYAQSHQKNGKA